MVKVWMVFEALGVEEEAVKKSLEDHFETFKSENGVEVLEVERDEVTEMENPREDIEKGYSYVMEVRAEYEKFDKAVRTVINYGPTYVQLEEPDVYDLKLSEAQNTLQNIATTMHQYAQMGAGGVLISRKADENQ